MRHRTTRSVLLAAATAFVLVACGTSGDDDASETTSAIELAEAPTSSTEEQQSPTSTPADDGAEPDGDDPAAPDQTGLPPRPTPGSCVDIPVADDGRYTVYEAGTAVVTFEDGRLVLGEIQEAEGWTARVDDRDDDEVEIDFRRNGQDVLDLEVEVDDGRVEVEICADDD